MSLQSLNHLFLQEPSVFFQKLPLTVITRKRHGIQGRGYFLILLSYNDRMFWIGKDLQRPSSSSPHDPEQGYLSGCTGLYAIWLWTLLGMGHPQQLWVICYSTPGARSPSPDSQATLLLMLPRKWSTHVQFFIHQYLHTSFQGCSQLIPPPVCTTTGDFPDPGAGLCISPCGKSWCFPGTHWDL